MAGVSAPPPPPKPHTQGSGSAAVNTMNSAHVPGQEASTAGGKSADDSALGEGHRETGDLDYGMVGHLSVSRDYLRSNSGTVE